MFQNVNKHWRAHLERLFGEVIWRAPNSFLDKDTQQTPDGGPIEPQWILDGPQLLSKWALQCLFTFWNINILYCNHWLDPVISCTDYNQNKMMNRT